MIFSLLDSPGDPCPNGCAKVMNGGLTPVRVTSEGHRLNSGQTACVSDDDPVLRGSIEKGAVSQIIGENGVSRGGERSKKDPKVPKRKSGRVAQDEKEAI